MSARPEPADQPAVVAGDALADLTPARTADGAAAFQPRPGGSCLNVAAGLGRLRVPTALLARISDDHFGDLLRAHLAASGTRLTRALPASAPHSHRRASARGRVGRLLLPRERHRRPRPAP
ncbi:PfkB family carbohydrate kinase [Streptomyces sp. NPDC052721]|uniref:PfkB family carbohydrate kinase n=1 Tax=Streptomyces sp. NPDC052721 TaxID=3154955 RepID=UPI003419D8DA